MSHRGYTYSPLLMFSNLGIIERIRTILHPQGFECYMDSTNEGRLERSGFFCGRDYCSRRGGDIKNSPMATMVSVGLSQITAWPACLMVVSWPPLRRY